jgi:uncharacterized membrane protein
MQRDNRRLRHLPADQQAAAATAPFQQTFETGQDEVIVQPGPGDAASPTRARAIGIGFVFLWFLIGGIAHFAATDTEVRLVPPWVPWPRAAVWISGVFELLGACGLLLRPTRRAAGIGLFALTIGVTPVHVYMLQRPELFGVPYWALVLRLPLQLALLVLIAWSCVRRAPVLKA